MISAKEARCRVENAKAIKELTEIIENSIIGAIKLGNYKVSVCVPKNISNKSLTVVIHDLEVLDYEIEYENEINRVLTIKW